MILPCFSSTIQNRKLAGDEESQSLLHCSHLNVTGACMHILFLAHFSFVYFFPQFLSVSLLHTHTHTCQRTRMLLKETCDSDSDGDFTYNRKQAQDPPGSLHTTVSSVE